MKISNNITLMPVQNPKANVNKNESNINFAANYDSVFANGKMARDVTKKFSSEFKKTITPEKQSKIMNVCEKAISWVAKSDWFDRLSKMGGVDTLAYMVVLGNTAKEAVGTTIYTVQALTNEDLEPDKRKFVGMYDLAVGVISTTLSLFAGVAMVKYQGRLIKALIGGEKAKNFAGYAKAFSGLAFIMPVAVQTLLIKRIIAPAVAVPIAGQLKEKLEAKEGAKKGTKKKDDNISPMPKEALVLADNNMSFFKQRLKD